jgi:hypothetical protein
MHERDYNHDPQAAFQSFAARQREPNGRRAEYLKLEHHSAHFSRTEHGREEYLFVNGAKAVQTSLGEWVFWDPPTDPIALLQARKAALQAFLQREISEWEKYRAHCYEQNELAKTYSNFSPVDNRALRVLREGQQRIEMMRNMIAEIDKALDQTPNNQAVVEQQRFMAEREAARRAGQAEASAAIRSLSI